MTLPVTGKLSYGTYTFDGATHIEASIRFAKDDAQRTTTYHEITIRAQGILAGGTDTTVEQIRIALGLQGQKLVFTNKGFGSDLTVNDPSGAGLRDVKWGPRPEVVSWNPIGSSNACEFEWVCVVCVPKYSTSANLRSIGVMAINYSADYSIDDRGFTTRSIVGYLEIAQTRLGTTTPIVPDCADRYRELISPAAPLGFTREQSWKISLDKSRLDFSITDKEIPSPNPYPQFVTRIEGAHRFNWAPRSSGFQVIRNTLSLDLEVAPGAPAALGWVIFGNLLKQRIDVPRKKQLGVFLESLDVEEQLFSYRSSFSATYRILCGVQDLIGSTGLWQPLGNNWQYWKYSMAKTLSVRGSSGLQLLPANDAIVDLGTASPTIPWNAQSGPQQQKPIPKADVFVNKLPPSSKSYINYEMSVVPIRERPVIRQSPLQPAETGYSGGSMNDTTIKYEAGGGTADTIQTAGSSRYTVALVGSGTRCGFQIPRPSIANVGSQKATEVKATFMQKVLGNFFGIPVYQAAWQIIYAIPNSPSQVQTPCNMYTCDDKCTTVQV